MLEQKIYNLLKQDNCKIEEAKIFQDQISNPFWHSSVITKDGHPISAGFDTDRFTARKIAIAEYLERKLYTEIANSSEEIRKKWGLNHIKTACGFAVGFNSLNTRLRSIGEGLERWVMSKWIDEGYIIETNNFDNIKNTLSSASLFFISQFEEVLFYKKSVSINIDGKIVEFEIAQTMGIKGNGIYPGSSAQNTGRGIWEHALVESFRHLIGVQNNPVRKNVFPDDKIHFFSENKKLALEQIDKANKAKWPIPQFKLHCYESFFDGDVFLSRTIINGWKSWDKGPVERFLY